MTSVRRIGLVRLCTFSFNRAYRWSSHPILVVYPAEHVVIGPANHTFVWVAFANKHCTAMVLRISSSMAQRGSRKCGTLGAWFSEPPNKELAGIWSGHMDMARTDCYVDRSIT